MMEDDKAELRKIQRRLDDSWEQVRMSELVSGDVIRMFEPTGEPVSDVEGILLLKVVDEPYLAENENGNKVWTVKTNPLRGE